MAFAFGQPVAAEMAPAPVENGDVYFSAGIAMYYYNTQSFQIGRRYADDDFTGTGEISTNNPEGFLMSFDMDENNVVTPEVNFGYAFEKPLFNGALGGRTRLHFAAYGNRREGSGFIPYAEPTQQAWPLVDPTTGMVEMRDTYIYMQPINGNEFLANGDDATWFLAAPFENNSMQFETYFGSGDMMLYFDEPKGRSLQFSRGVGLTIGYEHSTFNWVMNSPVLEVVVPGLTPATWNYDMNIGTFYVGPRAGFSMGYEPVRQLSLFLAGGFAIMAAISNIEGTQIGQCLGACSISGVTSTGTVGIATLNATDVNFAYDARIETGLSFYLWVFRVSGSIGAFVNNQFAMPQEGDGTRYETILAGQWGYFGRAMATFNF